MAKMVDMARTEGEKKAEAEAISGARAAGVPDYKYGHRITLDKADLEKLGIKDLPKPGDEVSINARAKVASVHSNDNADGTGDSGVHLQITHMGVDGEPPPRGALARKLYQTSSDANYSQDGE